MRKLLAILALSVAVPAFAGGGINLDTSNRFEFTNCSSSGSSAQTVTAGQYLLRITDESTWLCFAASSSTCASGGEKFPSGTVILLSFPRSGLSVSCRSSSSGGDAIFTAAN